MLLKSKYSTDTAVKPRNKYHKCRHHSCQVAVLLNGDFVHNGRAANSIKTDCALPTTIKDKLRAETMFEI